MPLGRAVRRRRGGAARAGSPAIEVRSVSFGYGTASPVLEDVSLEVQPGELVAIAGPNGGGKTTLLRLILGLERPRRGSVRVFGEPVGAGGRVRGLGYVPQRARLASDAPVTVLEVVSSGRLASAGVLGPLRRADREAVAEAIRAVGLEQRARARLRTLSGGMQQRAFIARSLASEPRLLALDEPTTGIDAGAQVSLAALLATLRSERGLTALYVSHELSSIVSAVDRLVIVRGGILFDGPPAELPDAWHDPVQRGA